MLNDYYEYNIADHFASALINHDYSGLEDDEDQQLQDFLGSVPNNLIAGTWAIEDGEPSFERCDVCNLHADCVTARLYFHNETINQGE